MLVFVGVLSVRFTKTLKAAQKYSRYSCCSRLDLNHRRINKLVKKSLVIVVVIITGVELGKKKKHYTL